MGDRLRDGGLAVCPIAQWRLAARRNSLGVTYSATCRDSPPELARSPGVAGASLFAGAIAASIRARTSARRYRVVRCPSTIRGIRCVSASRRTVRGVMPSSAATSSPLSNFADESGERRSVEDNVSMGRNGHSRATGRTKFGDDFCLPELIHVETGIENEPRRPLSPDDKVWPRAVLALRRQSGWDDRFHRKWWTQVITGWPRPRGRPRDTEALRAAVELLRAHAGYAE